MSKPMPPAKPRKPRKPMSEENRVKACASLAKAREAKKHMMLLAKERYYELAAQSKREGSSIDELVRGVAKPVKRPPQPTEMDLAVEKVSLEELAKEPKKEKKENSNSKGGKEKKVVIVSDSELLSSDKSEEEDSCQVQEPKLRKKSLRKKKPAPSKSRKSRVMNESSGDTTVDEVDLDTHDDNDDTHDESDAVPSNRKKSLRKKKPAPSKSRKSRVMNESSGDTTLASAPSTNSHLPRVTKNDILARAMFSTYERHTAHAYNNPPKNSKGGASDVDMIMKMFGK